MIIIKLQGGLGNQMFQYAAARRLAIINHTSLKLDTTALVNDELRSYALNSFNIYEEFVTQRELNFIYRLIGWRRRILQLVPAATIIWDKYVPWKIVQEIQAQNVDSTVIRAKGNVYLDGYWQSEKYFIDIQDIIRGEFSFKSHIFASKSEIKELIANTHSIGLHIRRGDYIANSSINQSHGTCDLSYYRYAVDFFARRISIPHFFVFSDDPAWCKQNLILDHPVTVVSQSYSNSDHEDLQLMSQCQHQIIANSTFSWWAAWLNPNPEKIVIAPQRWFRQRCTPNDLIPVEWIKI